MFKVALIALFFPILAFADTPPGDCYRHEIDPHTGRFYQNRTQWEADRVELWKSAPPAPSFFRRWQGYKVAMVESPNSHGIGSDKRKHCYVGCRIAAVVGPDVAEYAAYYKEDKDILDCSSQTHFDLMDIKATMAGALLATIPEKSDANFCRTECRKLIRR
jgi:hypothetical protein